MRLSQTNSNQLQSMGSAQEGQHDLQALAVNAPSRQA
jgi:hypothetical protein